MSDNLCRLSATELGKLFRKGEVRPSEVLASVFDRIEAAEPLVNAFSTLDVAGATSSAKVSDARFQQGKPLGPFDGIPVSIKDNITVAGLRCAWGSEIFKDYVPALDETPVARLRDQGAVILGKTNVSEFTMGQGQVSTKLFGTTRNPWDTKLTPGSSSGGAVAAVATGMGPVALGTDGGGSIRRPAGFAGLVGLKPTLGRVARYNGLPIVMNGAEVIGPLTRTVDDLAMTLTAIQGPLDEDMSSLAFRADEAEPAIRPLRILYVPRFGASPVDEEIAISCSRAAAHLAELGHHVEEGSMPFDVSFFDRAWPVICGTGLAWLLRDEAWEGRIGDVYAQMVESGKSLSAVDYMDALTCFRESFAQFARFFRTYDILMTPASGALQWAAENPGPSHHRVFTGIVNVAGLPAISVPAEQTQGGLPVGFQLVAPYGADWLLVALARHFEVAHPWRARWPEI